MKTLAFLFSTILLTGTVFASGQIDIAYSPYTISNPGSYIVVKNLTTAQNFDGITINASNVTLDLNGHTLYGPGTTTGTGESGIFTGGGGNNITITNGAIRNFNGDGIGLPRAQAHISKVKIIGCSNTGISVDGGIIENNFVSQIGQYGIKCDNTMYPAVISKNVVTYGGYEGYEGYGISVTTNCDITGNTVTNINYIGIYVLTGNSKITGNVVDSNNNQGIYVFGSNCTITGNNVTNTIHGSGIITGSGCNIIGNTVANNSTNGINAGGGSRVSDNVVSSNGSDGIDVGSGSLVQGNTLRNNGNNGLSASGANHIEANNFSANVNVGLYVSGGSNTILNNSLFTSSTGLWISGSHNFFAGNTLRGNTSVDTAISANNTAGNGTTGFVNIVVP